MAQFNNCEPYWNWYRRSDDAEIQQAWRGADANHGGAHWKWRHRQGLTPMDLLIAVRFNLANKYAWEEAVEEAAERHAEWLAYYDDGRAEETPGDRKIAALEAEIARLKGAHSGDEH